MSCRSWDRPAREGRIRARAGTSRAFADRVRTELTEVPWWAGLMLTASDVTHRPWGTLTVWTIVLARAMARSRAREHGEGRPK